MVQDQKLLIAEVAKKGRGGRGENRAGGLRLTRYLRTESRKTHISQRERFGGTLSRGGAGGAVAGIFRPRLCFATAKHSLRSR
jgi:hypothetical protein